MINFVQPGDSAEYSNSGSAIASGAMVNTGHRIGIAAKAIAATTGTGTVHFSGVYSLSKSTSESVAAGTQLFADTTAQTVTAVPAAGLIPCGVAHEAAATSDTTVNVRLTSQPKRAAGQADFAGADLAAVKVELNALLAKLRAAGIIATL